jgi:uncharacterized membrane protein YhhN
MAVDAGLVRSVGLSRAVALGLSAAASLAYLLFPRWAPSSLEIVVKGLSVTLLALIAFQANRRLLSLALLLSSLGDVLLARGLNFFLWGLAAFLCAHLVYIALFVRRRASAAAASGQWAFPALVLVFGWAFGAYLAPSLGALRVPVFCYIAAIVAMVAAASRANYRSRWVLAGAVLFLVSDSLLGAGRFKTPIPLGGPLVWITYYAGQCAITLGVLSEPDYRLTSDNSHAYQGSRI